MNTRRYFCSSIIYSFVKSIRDLFSSIIVTVDTKNLEHLFKGLKF